MYEEVVPHLFLDTDQSEISFLFTVIKWIHERKAALNKTQSPQYKGTETFTQIVTTFQSPLFLISYFL